MKKYLSFVIVFLALLSSCSIFGNKSTPMPKSENLMLEAVSLNYDLVNFEEDFLDSRFFQLSYSGELSYHEIYNLSGRKNDKLVRISSEDLETIYNILLHKVKYDKDIEAYDGTA